jgi:hypothetical protein
VGLKHGGEGYYVYLPVWAIRMMVIPADTRPELDIRSSFLN